MNAISRIRYPRGGTKTGYAMRYTYSRVFRYARRRARKVNIFCCQSLLPKLSRDACAKGFLNNLSSEAQLKFHLELPRN